MTIWTDQEVRELVSLWPNASAAQIASTLHRSRASICRKVQRLQQEGSLPRNVIKHFEVVPVRASPRRRCRIPAPKMPPPPPIDDALAMLPCSISELDEKRCHWPLDDNSGILFCGGPTLSRCPYCAHHLQLARGQDRRRTA